MSAEAGGSWEQVGLLLERVLALPPEQRSGFLDESCGRDTPLRAELESLLAASEQAGTFFGDLAAEVVSPARAALAAAATADPLLGHVVAHYEILAPLGAGGMGVVYRAHDRKLDREVALKFLPAALAREPQARRQLLREARAAAVLDDPHICTVHAVEETADGQAFIVMALYRGETLRELLTHGPLPIGRALAVGADIAHGLAHAHARGVVHRDLKPGNVMLTRGGGLKILDFGLARLLGATGATRSGAGFGTVGYMAPEQVEGAHVDARADVWALGVILYELLAGRRPFRGDSEAAVLHAILHTEPEPLSRARPELPLAVDALLQRLLSKRPGDRPADGAAVLRAIEHLGAGQAPGPRQPAGRRRARRAVAAGTASLLVGAAVYVLLPERPGLPPSAPPGTMEAVAVLPFTVRGDPGLEYLHEGLVDLLSTKLDGVAGLHTLDANAVLGHPALVRGEPVALERGREVAGALGATHFVLGSVVRVGTRIQLVAGLYEADGREVARAQALVSGEDGVLGGIDELARGLVSSRLREPAEQLAGLAAMTTHSYPAMRAFLSGERLLREGRPDAALGELRRAVALDSGFAIAWYRLARAAGWTGDEPLNTLATARAAQYAAPLPHRARQVVEAYSIFRTGDPAEAERRYRSILAMHPDDAETWLLLGELLFHHNPYSGRPIAEASAPLQRALALDPDNREVLVHLMDLAAREHRLADLDTLSTRYLRAAAGGERPGMRPAYRALRALALDGPGALDSAAATLREAGPDAQLVALLRVAPQLDDLAPAERFAALLAEPATAPPLRATAELHRALFAAARGRWADAERAWAAAEPTAPALTRLHRALAYSLPFSPATDSLLAALGSQLRHWDAERQPLENGTHSGELDLVRDYLFGLLSWRSGDTAAVVASAAQLRAAPAAGERAQTARAFAATLEGLAAWRRGDAPAALAALERAELRLPFHVRAASPLLAQPLVRFARAELYREAGRPREALRWYDSLRDGTHAWSVVFLAPAALQRAVLLDREGRGAEALRAYRLFLRTWRGPAPAPWPDAARVAERVARLEASVAARR